MDVFRLLDFQCKLCQIYLKPYLGCPMVLELLVGEMFEGEFADTYAEIK